MTALTVYLQNTWFSLKERQEGQTMAEYALILGGIAIFVMVAVFFLGGKIKDLFDNTGSSVRRDPGSARSTPWWTWRPVGHSESRLAAAHSFTERDQERHSDLSESGVVPMMGTAADQTSPGLAASCGVPIRRG